MSRAFVKDDDETFEELPDRSISPAPNWVTTEGLAAIEVQIESLTRELTAIGDNRYERARIGRDLRYWTARRGSAHVKPPPRDAFSVQFGSSATIVRNDGRRETFRIVGEDEADPSHGTISYVSPLAQVILGKGEGDMVRVSGADIDIVSIR